MEYKLIFLFNYILRLRERALETLRNRMIKLKDASTYQELSKVEEWFKKYDPNFRPENIFISLSDEPSNSYLFSI